MIRGGIAYNYQNDQHASQASHVDCASSEMRHEGEAYQRTNNKTGIDTHVQVKSGIGRESGCFQEDHGITRERVSIKDLTGPSHNILIRQFSECPSQTRPDLYQLTISVRRRFVPRKQSKKLAPSTSSLSISVVCWIYARVASMSSSV